MARRAITKPKPKRKIQHTPIQFIEMPPESNIFESTCEALVNPVNCVGIMGKGLALAFKKRYPKMFDHYDQLCHLDGVCLGVPFLYVPQNGDKKIINFPTKQIIHEESKYDTISTGIQRLGRLLKAHKIQSVAIPALGCGCGKLKWERVLPILKSLSGDNLRVELYGPHTKPHNVIFFSNKQNRHFSNFSPHGLIVGELRYPTMEHYFQSMKFPDNSEHQRKIRAANTPNDAKRLGRVRVVKIREDWNDVKEDIMYKGLSAKFTQHGDLYRALLKTGSKTLVEENPYDDYWANGSDCLGKNRLGVLLMKLRDEFNNKGSIFRYIK
jgi:ribA/ribD-fused uncharacterized protein